MIENTVLNFAFTDLFIPGLRKYSRQICFHVMTGRLPVVLKSRKTQNAHQNRKTKESLHFPFGNRATGSPWLFETGFYAVGVRVAVLDKQVEELIGPKQVEKEQRVGVVGCINCRLCFAGKFHQRVMNKIVRPL